MGQVHALGDRLVTAAHTRLALAVLVVAAVTVGTGLLVAWWVVAFYIALVALAWALSELVWQWGHRE